MENTHTITLQDFRAVILNINSSPIEIKFKESNICGVHLPEMILSQKTIMSFRGLLVSEGLLNPDDDLIEELRCEFYRQMLHGFILKQTKKRIPMAA